MTSGASNSRDKILVTGGGGFIGSNIVNALAASGARVVVSDVFEDGPKWRNLLSSAVEDIITPDSTFDWLAREAADVAAIIHMGAISATTEPDVDKIIRNNVRLSLDLWAYAASEGVPFIYASSAATYGAGSQGFVDEENPDALSRLRPLNAYGWSKLMVDRRFISDIRAGRPHPPQWAGLRFFNVYGKGEEHKGDMRSVINKIYPVALAGETVTLFKSHHPAYEDGGQLRDFVHVDDCVAIVTWLLENPKVNGIFNVGTGAARSFADLARAVFRGVGSEPKIAYVDMPNSIRPNYQYFTQADLTKLRQAGYAAPFRSLEDGIDEYIRHHLAAVYGTS